MTDAASAPRPTLGFRELVGLVAGLMAINALGIDIMLPALPAIGTALHVASPNDRQLVVAIYVLGFGAAQIVYGPLSDRFGRKPVLLGGLSAFVLLSLMVSLARSFPLLIVARFLQGVAAATPRVIVVSVVRDLYSGREMAKVMSLGFAVFLAVPILAPTIGQGILLVGSWRLIFWFLAAFGTGMAIWSWLRLPETLHPEFRRPISARSWLAAVRAVLAERAAVGYSAAAALMYGALMGFINSVQQIFTDALHAPRVFTLAFAGMAASMSVASVLNARIVGRLGTHRVSHGALLGLIAVSLLHVAIALSGYETVASFALLQAATMFCFALATSNFNAMAMQPVGHIAGIASSLQGFGTTVGGAVIGLMIGRSFDGTTRPIALGYLLTGAAALIVVLATERGRLFRPILPATAS